MYILRQKNIMLQFIWYAAQYRHRWDISNLNHHKNNNTFLNIKTEYVLFKWVDVHFKTKDNITLQFRWYTAQYRHILYLSNPKHNQDAQKQQYILKSKDRVCIIQMCWCTLKKDNTQLTHYT